MRGGCRTMSEKMKRVISIVLVVILVLATVGTSVIGYLVM